MSPQHVTVSTAQSHRAAAVLLAEACGDALGVPYEFGTAPAADQLAEMRGGGLGPYAPGEWSDDTQMGVCIARVASSGADLTTEAALDDIARALLDWAGSGATDIGVQTSLVLRAANRAGGPAGRRTAAAARAHAAGHASSRPGVHGCVDGTTGTVRRARVADDQAHGLPGCHSLSSPSTPHECHTPMTTGRCGVTSPSGPIPPFRCSTATRRLRLDASS